jgi:hypothetical protein
VSWFAASAYCSAQGARLPRWNEWEYVAAADESAAMRASDPGLARAHPRLVRGARDASVARIGGGRAERVRPSRPCTAWSGSGRRPRVAAGERPTIASRAIRTSARFCGAGALSVADREQYAVLMRVALLSSLEACRLDEPAWIPLREGRSMNPIERWCRVLALVPAMAVAAADVPADSIFRVDAPMTDAQSRRFVLGDRRGQAAGRHDVLHRRARSPARC